jgi:hypothetical protein
MDNLVVLYFFLLLFGALLVKFAYMFNDIFAEDTSPKKVYVNTITGEGPADSAKRWLQYHKKAIIGHRILNDINIPADERTDIDIGIDHAQSMLNDGGPCEITISTTNSFFIHVVNEILLILTKQINREIDATKSKMFYKQGDHYKSTLFVK